MLSPYVSFYPLIHIMADMTKRSIEWEFSENTTSEASSVRI